MITVKRLKELLEKVPDESTVSAYEGEDTGINVYLPDGSNKWIRAREDEVEDTFTEGFEDE